MYIYTQACMYIRMYRCFDMGSVRLPQRSELICTFNGLISKQQLKIVSKAERLGKRKRFSTPLHWLLLFLQLLGCTPIGLFLSSLNILTLGSFKGACVCAKRVCFTWCLMDCQPCCSSSCFIRIVEVHPIVIQSLGNCVKAYSN